MVLVCQLAAFALFRVYQGMWRYTSVGDFMRLAQAATVGTIAAVLVLLFLTRFAGYSRAVFVIDWLLLVRLGRRRRGCRSGPSPRPSVGALPTAAGAC